MRAVIVVVLACTSLPGTAGAALVGEGGEKSMKATRTDRAPEIDGLLDDQVWTRASPDRRFTQQFPIDGARPTVATEVRVLFDDDRLYIGLDARDPDPRRIIGRLVRRDRDIDSDWMEVVLDSRHDHDTGFIFRINAAGVLSDYQLHDDTRRNLSWDSVWVGRAARHSGGWSAELSIPLSVLRFYAGHEQVWGINVVRYVARSKETLQWVHVPQNQPGNSSRAGHLVGLGNLPEARALELRPFAVSRAELLLPSGGAALLGDGDIDFQLSGGLDFKYGLTSNLTLDATLNPDFGQVEVDEIILNLSRFEAFFPEKRPFFLESSDLFGTDLQLFYSRRLGAPTSGLSPGDSIEGGDLEVVDTPFFVPIWTATRLTGRLSRRMTIAAVDAITGPETIVVRSQDGTRELDASPTRNYGAVRGKYAFTGSSYLGFIATSRTQLGDSDLERQEHDAYAESIDGRWVAPDGRYRAYFMVGATHRVGGVRFAEAQPGCTEEACRRIRRIDGHTIGPGDSGFAGEFGGGQFGAENWTLYTRYRFATRRWDANAVGFETDWDYHKVLSRLTLREQKPFSVFQNSQLVVQGETSRALDGTHRDSYLQLVHSGLFSSFWSHSIGLTTRPVSTFSTRETFDGAAAERPASLAVSGSLASDTRRRVRAAANGAASWVQDDPARSWQVGGSHELQVIPAVEISTSGSWQVSDDDLRFYDCVASDLERCNLSSEMRDYTFARLSSSTLSLTTRVSWAISPMISVQSYLQLFAARGQFADYVQLSGIQPGRQMLRRAALEPSMATGDRDGDGIKDDDFSFATVNANLVFRWELWPGTVLIAAYTRAQRRADDPTITQPELRLSGLTRSRTEEAALLKLTLFL
ncbi:MAG: carbohydrate binding family 9 domain-containing protein [Deltaproteobacteria bacterium]|nr:carbohydrate binding family 9 domain-containing protein [Deltaproteobacteria bacterium]